MTTSISAVVCTHNPRQEFLERTLGGLKSQSLPSTQWELLLVDNASASPLAEGVDLSWHPKARHVREDKLGLTAARLRGIAESTGEIIVFVDDDTVLAPSYLEVAATVGKQWPFVGVWGGSIIPEYESPLPSWVRDEEWRLTVVRVERDIWSNLRSVFTTIPTGAGMCIRRSVGISYLERCNSIPERTQLDRTGAGLSGYGDLDLAFCALDLGLGTGLTPRLSLTHLIPSSRVTIDYFLRHAEGDAASLMVFRAMRGLPLEKPERETLLWRLRWLFHRWINRVPRESYELQKAHLRGLRRGYEMASQYVKGEAAS